MYQIGTFLCKRTQKMYSEKQGENNGTEQYSIEISDRRNGVRKIFCVYGKNSSLIRNRYV